jgi:hypothetical protein
MDDSGLLRTMEEVAAGTTASIMKTPVPSATSLLVAFDLVQIELIKERWGGRIKFGRMDSNFIIFIYLFILFYFFDYNGRCFLVLK